MNWFRLKTCIKCQGDLAADFGDWLCLQCDTYYYTGLYQVHAPIDTTAEVLQSSRTATPDDSGQKALGVGRRAIGLGCRSRGGVVMNATAEVPALLALDAGVREIG